MSGFLAVKVNCWNSPYYKDGTIVEWTGDENADTPHAITSIVDAAKLGHETVDAHGGSQRLREASTRYIQGMPLA